METHEKLHQVVLSAFNMQNALNSRLTPLWTEQGWSYYRALWTEAAEASQHCNWMWWKQGTFGQPESSEQLDQVKMELCDMFHFGLSIDIIASRHPLNFVPQNYIDYCARMYAAWFTGAVESELSGFHEALEHVVVTSIKDKHFDIEAFART
jgi:hypothetical protein